MIIDWVLKDYKPVETGDKNFNPFSVQRKNVGMFKRCTNNTIFCNKSPIKYQRDGMSE